MSGKTKGLLSLLIALVLTIAGSVMVFGEVVSQDDFDVVVTTDKDSYEEGEKIKLAFSIKNNSEVEITKVDFQYIIDKDIKKNIVNGDKLPTSLTTLDKGLNNLFDSNVVDKPDDDKKDDNKTDVNKPNNDNTGLGNSGVGTPGTGDESNIKLYVGILLIVAGVVIAVRMGCIKRFASLFMVVAMVAGLNATTMVDVYAAPEYMMVYGEKEITYAGKETSIVIAAYLTMDVESDGTEDDSDSDNTQVNITPTDLAKFLLANERLDTDELTSANKIISPNTMATAFNNLRVLTLSTNSGQYDKYSNMMEYFNSYINNIEGTVSVAADTIDYVKGNVGVLDVWVEYGAVGGEVLLQVNENDEYLFMRSDNSEYICHRYTDDNGDDVYEIYKEDLDMGIGVYLLCTPDKRYEYSYHHTNNTLDKVTDDFQNYVVIDNSRGYWNMFTTTPNYDENISTTGPCNYNVQNLVAGEEFAYVYFGGIWDKADGGYKSQDYITFITPELDCDIISAKDIYAQISLAGFNGIASFETDANNAITSFTTTGGKVVSAGDKIGGVEYWNGQLEQTNGGNPILNFRVLDGNGAAGIMTGAGVTKILNTLKSIGVVCKSEDDLNSIISAVDSSYKIADNFDNYYQWNGYKLTDIEAANNAVAAGREKHEALMDMYDAVKDAEKIEEVTTGIDYSNYDFAGLTLKASESVSFDESKVTVNGFEVEISVADVMESGKTYELQFGLASNADGVYDSVILLDTEENGVATYSGSAFTLNKSAEFTIPACTSGGVYTLVAYVATSDGIRVSEMLPITFTSGTSYTDIIDGYEMAIKLNDSDEMVVSYTLANEYWVEVTENKDVYDYQYVYELLLAKVYEYGYPDMTATLEVYNVNTGESREATQNESLNGLVCRLAYDIPNMTAMTGYVYVELPQWIK